MIKKVKLMTQIVFQLNQTSYEQVRQIFVSYDIGSFVYETVAKDLLYLLNLRTAI